MTAPASSWRQWSAAGGQLWMGYVVPALVALFGLFTLFEGASVLTSSGRGVSPAIFLWLLTGLAGWVAWNMLRTGWLVLLSDEGTLHVQATARTWTIAPGEIESVKRDAYGGFIIIDTTHGRVWVFAGIRDRDSLYAAMRRWNPGATFDVHI